MKSLKNKLGFSPTVDNRSLFFQMDKPDKEKPQESLNKKPLEHYEADHQKHKLKNRGITIS